MTGIAYAIITLATSTLWGVLSGWLLYFYLPPSGTSLVPAALFSLVILLSRVANAAITLPIGYLSDRTRTRWGRRLPYIFGGAFAIPWLFFLLWTPPHPAAQSPWNLLYLAAVMLAYNIVYEIHQVPYEALLPELIGAEKQRINISAWRSGFQLGGAVLAGAVGPMLETLGYGSTMMIFALGTIPFLCLPAFFLHEPKNADLGREVISFRDSLRLTIHNRAFQVYTLAWVLFWMASTFVMETLPYIVTEVCRLGEADTIFFYLPAILVSLACFPLVTWLANRYGKGRIFSLSLLAGALVLPGLFLIGAWIPLPLIVQGISWIILEAIALSGAQVLPAAIAAEVTDLDAQQTGQRRAGSFYAMWGLLDQLASGFALALLPLFLLLGRSALSPHGPLGVRILGLVGGGLLLAGFFIFRAYPARRVF